ncbi:tyrosine-protein kinase transmembrane receptor Ror-like isoform X2 [Rhodnius prolixus]|uniref:tyrosine-protein kinase transmembrane receptor Ror-like isoform X2 n=1 Tax=Rhodnius prolixus TaxID=13249 RepID=UPI003D18CB89
MDHLQQNSRYQLLMLLLIATSQFRLTATRPDSWTEELGEEHTSIVLPHYELYDYEETGNWTDDVTDTPSNATGYLRWSKELSNVTKEEGEGVKMRCEVEGEPGPITVRWLRNEAPLEAGLGPAGRRRLALRTSQTTVKTSSRLRITRLETHDSGFYTCQARNGAGKLSSTTGLLKVRMAPWGHDMSRARVSNFPLFPEQIESIGVSDREIAVAGLGTIVPHDSGRNSENLRPICQLYQGKLCASVLANKTVYIPANITQAQIEEKLESAFTVVSHSEDLSKTCEPYAVPSLCYTAFAVCRSDESLPPKQICRKDCEFLENELCRKEYAIAKRHPLIGRQLEMPVCVELPNYYYDDCLTLDLPQPDPVVPGDYCYWGRGESYRGAVGVGQSGTPCVPWAEQLSLSIADHHELLGSHNYCRNPGSLQSQPWCYTNHNGRQMVEMCNIHKCVDTLWLYLTAGCCGLLVLLVILLTYCCCKARTRKRNNLQNDAVLKAKGSGLEMSALIPGSGASSVKSEARSRVREFHPANIRFVQELGEGAFGKVYKGEIVGTGEEPLLVAIKTLKENASAKTTADFRREVDLMCELRHENIVCLLGVCLSREPLCMLFEFMPKGDLHEFLITHSPHSTDGMLTQTDLLNMATHIASGMEYLCSHHYVHRDLAARNCLVAENLTVKISDFGLSRDVYSSDYYRVQSKSLLPVRWMPPESILYGKFTTESDVWSYGVVLWEIYSYGLQPYYGYSNQEVIEMIRSRQLLPCPEDCPSRMYSVMMECWHEVPVRRPHFPELSARLRSFQQNGMGVRLPPPPPSLYAPSPAHI